MRKRGILFLLIFLALAGFIVFTSTNSGNSHNELGGRTIAWINEHIFANTLTASECDSIVGVSAKLFGHFSLFLLDGLFLYLFLRETKLKGKAVYLIFILIGIVLSSIGEIVQIFSDGRYPSVFDVILDFSGFFLPLLFVFARKANQ
ncbi:MAG: VanZ family protein [Bacilli bacterium]|nr:VanZ family protein [Bacilli bacterium]